MDCTRALELDLAAFLARPGADEWTTFRDHYPRCRECVVHVRTWTELTAALAADAHPDPETLVRFVDAAGSLSATTRATVTQHLTVCAACRDEAKTLGTFDLAAVTTPSVPRRAPARPRRAALRVLWHPALAYAAALVAVVYPFLSGRMQAPEVDHVVARGAGSRSTDGERRLPAENAAPRRELAKDERSDDAPPPPSPRAAAKAKEAPAVAQPAPLPAGPPPESKRVGEHDGEHDAVAPAPSSGLAIGGLERARQTAPSRASIVLAADGENTITLAEDGTDVAVTVAGMEPRRMRNLRRLDGAPSSLSDAPVPDPARVPTRWLTPGRYALDVIGPDERTITVTFRIVRP